MINKSAVQLYGLISNKFSVMAATFLLTLEPKIITLDSLLSMFCGNYSQKLTQRHKV